MRKLITVILAATLCMTISSANAQSQDKKARKQAKREEQAKIQQQRIAMTTMAVDSSSFVLEADRLQNKWGNTINVSSNLNFIALHGESCFVQVGSNTHFGPNGVGGVSIDTRVNKMNVKKNKKNDYYTIDLICMSNQGTFYITISSSNDGQIASASITSNWGGRLTYLGKLVPTDESTVYKGTPRY